MTNTLPCKEPSIPPKNLCFDDGRTERIKLILSVSQFRKDEFELALLPVLSSFINQLELVKLYDTKLVFTQTKNINLTPINQQSCHLQTVRPLMHQNAIITLLHNNQQSSSSAYSNNTQSTTICMEGAYFSKAIYKYCFTNQSITTNILSTSVLLYKGNLFPIVPSPFAVEPESYLHSYFSRSSTVFCLRFINRLLRTLLFIQLLFFIMNHLTIHKKMF